MIGKILRHPDFAALSSYVLRGELKQPEVLAASGVRTSSAGEMAADFELQRSLRPRLRQALEHVALAWPPGEKDKLTDNDVMVRAAKLYMEERGIDPATTQWVLVRHHDQEHPHCHLLLNRVTDNGQVLPDSQSHRNSAAACRKVEAAMGFVDAAQLGRTARLKQAEQGELPVDVAKRVQCKDYIRQALEKHLPAATTVRELREALATEGVRMKATLQQGGQLQAVVFEADAYPGLHVKGSEVAREYSGVGLRKNLDAQAEHREATTALAELTAQVAVPTVRGVAAALPAIQPAQATSLESALPVVLRQALVMSAEGSVAATLAPVEAGQLSPPASVQGPASVPAPATDQSSVPLPERNVPVPVPMAAVVLPPTAGAAVPPVGLTEASEPLAGRAPLGPIVPADPPAVVSPVEAVAQPLRSAPVTPPHVPAIPESRALIAGTPAVPANADGAAPGAVNGVPWQHGIIRMLATEKRTSEARLSMVRAALITAGATVGKVVPPTEGRNLVPLLAYSFDPASTRLAEINKVLSDVQAQYNEQQSPTSKVQEQQHPWHQPGSAVAVDNLTWPEREGQFNHAQILVNDPVAGPARAKRIADDLRLAGASVGEITRGDQGVMTLQVHFHTCAPDTNDIGTALGRVVASAAVGIQVQESQQNKDAHIAGMVLVETRQKEKDTDRERGA
jgi:Relaxase/Mobilisation nuclease domain